MSSAATCDAWGIALPALLATDRAPLSAPAADLDLVQSCRNGDEDAWRELVRRYARRVYAVAYRFTARTDEAEDLTQDVFVRVYQSLDRFREGEGSFPTWLMTVARNQCIDQYRRRREERLRRSEDALALDERPGEGASPLDGVERRERAELLRSGLRSLPPDLREPLVLCDLRGLAYEDIASTLGLPLGTVKSRINRARLELARRLRARRASGHA